MWQDNFLFPARITCYAHVLLCTEKQSFAIHLVRLKNNLSIQIIHIPNVIRQLLICILCHFNFVEQCCKSLTSEVLLQFVVLNKQTDGYVSWCISCISWKVLICVCYMLKYCDYFIVWLLKGLSLFTCMYFGFSDCRKINCASLICCMQGGDIKHIWAINTSKWLHKNTHLNDYSALTQFS